jgi:PHD/YefM family antitoxin component YafN of YafNO toxin-antitoxin module
MLRKPPLTVDNAEFVKNPRRFQVMTDRRSIVLSENGKERYVLIDIDEWNRLCKRDRVALKTTDLSQADIEEIDRSEPAEEAKRFDHELEGWDPDAKE